MKKVKKHLGILGSNPSAMWMKNNEQLYCKNCGYVPSRLTTKEEMVSVRRTPRNS